VIEVIVGSFGALFAFLAWLAARERQAAGDRQCWQCASTFTA
jgi:hypothetical protein